MPVYNSLISRTDAGALIPEEAAREIIQNVPTRSATLQLMRRLQNMQRGQARLPVMSALPSAYFVTGDTGLKQTTEVNWDNVTIYAEELAVILPIPETVIDDSDFDIWGEVRPLVEEAIGVAIDAAILVGTNKPSSWPTDILAGAVAASQTVDHSSVSGDYFDEILGEVGTMAMVEADGYMVTGHVAHPVMLAGLRGLRETGGAPIFLQSMQQSGDFTLAGQPIEFVRNGTFASTTALMFSGDWSQAVYSIRQDLTYKFLDQAVIQDGAGNILYNLAQQDMVALRVVMRLGWALPNPINRMNQTAATRYPFAVLVP